MEIVEAVGRIIVGVFGFIDGHLGVTIAFLGLAITWYRVSGEWRQSRELNLRIAYQNFSSSRTFIQGTLMERKRVTPWLLVLSGAILEGGL